jgi:sarcosine oxidase
MTSQNDYIVVGAGLLGLAAARALSGRGREVTVLEQAGVGHEGSGSKGGCRIFRFGYPEPEYVAMVARARGLWRELEDQSGRQLLLPVPHLTFGPDLPAVRAALAAVGLPCELLPPDEAAARFPAVRLPGPVLLEPESAVIAADQALAALAGDGPQVRTGVRVTGLADDGRRVRVETSAGPLSARVVIICAGPFTSGLLGPAGMAVPAAATQEQVAYLAPAAAGAARPAAGQPRVDESPVAPIIIGHDAPSPYGLPVPGSDRYKFGLHHTGPPVRPGSQPQDPDPAMTAALVQAAAELLPGFSPDPVAAERCVYDNSPDHDFILDRVGQVVIGCGTSGHGFKFGPLLGEWLASLATGERDDLPGPRFSLSRFARPQQAADWPGSAAWRT